MEAFFQVTDIETVLGLRARFETVDTQEDVVLGDALGRVLARDIRTASDIPGFNRATMDGYALRAASTFGASESNPAYLTVVGNVAMGEVPRFFITPGQAAGIATGGMLPDGSDSVVMIEHCDVIDSTTIEVYRSVAPGQHVVAKDEDAAAGAIVLKAGVRLRPQELGLLAACGAHQVTVFRRPRVGIISTGDEVVPIDVQPKPGQIRDVNSHSMAALVRQAGGQPRLYGIVGDRFDELNHICRQALAETDMVLASGGSSVGKRDLTLDVLSRIPDSRILVHGISIRPGKPTILAQCGSKAFWGLPGHVTSGMVVFMILVRPFLAHIGGQNHIPAFTVKARLARNLASAQGRVDFVRVRLKKINEEWWAEPVLGASGLIRTMVAADGLVAVGLNSEGLDEGSVVDVAFF